MSAQSRQDVPQHVDAGLRPQANPPGHPAVGDQCLQREAHLIRGESLEGVRETDTEEPTTCSGDRVLKEASDLLNHTFICSLWRGLDSLTTDSSGQMCQSSVWSDIGGASV